jgi:hypothetical protein
LCQGKRKLSDIDVLRAQVKTLTDLVLSRNDNKKPAPPQFDQKIECFHCKVLGHTRMHCNWIGVGNDCIANVMYFIRIKSYYRAIHAEIISNTVKQAYKDGTAKFEMWCRTEEDQNHI